MEDIHVENHPITLVDKVEERLLSYFKEKELKVGSAIPNETELASALGVARSVLREALSRLKMMGMIESRTRRGMVLCEPMLFEGMRKVINPQIFSEELLFDIIEFRVALEIGISDNIFRHITPKDIVELEEIVKVGVISENNLYTVASESAFHTKLYEITGNKTVAQFQGIIHPLMDFLKSKHKDLIEPYNAEMRAQGKLVTHADLIQLLKQNDVAGYKVAIEKHFAIYQHIIKNLKKK